MQPILEQLNAIPGVLGSLRCDAQGAPVEQALPAEQLDADLRAAAAAAADSLRALALVGGTPVHLDLHFPQRRLLVLPEGAGAVVLVCEKGINPRLVLQRSAEVLPAHAAPPPTRGPAATPRPAPAPRDHAPARAIGAPAPAPQPTAPAPAWRRPPVVAGVAAALVVLAGLAWWAARRPAGETPAAGPAAAAPAAARSAAAIEPTVVLRIGGARSFAVELAPALARAYLESLELKDVSVAKLEGGRLRAQGQRDGQAIGILVEGMNTPDGFDRLAAGQLDIAMAGRRIKPEWQEKLASKGSMMAPGREHVVALSGIAVIVNAANRLGQLSRAQLADVFAGAVTDWAALRGGRGGPAAPIHVYAADDKMGLADLFRALVLEKRPYAPEARRMASLQEITDAVALDPDGIGYVTLPFVRGTRAVPISEGDEPPLMPTAFTLATEDYFLTHRLYFYALPTASNQHLVKFLQFALGPEGQAVVKRSGYVELSVANAPREPPRDAPPAYARLVRGAARLSSTFRFEPGSADFDARALMDLERVTSYLIEHRLNGAAVRVMGFADSMGNPATNLELSLARAQQVERALAQRGINGVEVQGFGHALPVASNATKEGRERNRRVEVWVAR